MAGDNDKPVPKFGSFQPRKRPTTDNTDRRNESKKSGAQSAAKDEQAVRSIDEEHPAKRRRVAHRSHRRPSPEAPKEPKRQNSSTLTVQTRKLDESCPSTEQSPADFYTIDTKGDEANWTYRAPSKWGVPKYHVNADTVLGLNMPVGAPSKQPELSAGGAFVDSPSEPEEEFIELSEHEQEDPSGLPVVTPKF